MYENAIDVRVSIEIVDMCLKLGLTDCRLKMQSLRVDSNFLTISPLAFDIDSGRRVIAD